jgi:hypothetical protein
MNMHVHGYAMASHNAQTFMDDTASLVAGVGGDVPKTSAINTTPLKYLNGPGYSDNRPQRTYCELVARMMSKQ